MKPRIDINITDFYGDSVDKLLDVNGFVPYEIYLNGSKIYIGDQSNELNNEKLKELLLKCWITIFGMRKLVKKFESSLDSSYVDILNTAITDIKNDILNSGIIRDDELNNMVKRMLTSIMKIN